MADFYSNENFPFPVVEILRGMGHDVLTSKDMDKVNQSIPDTDVLRLAASMRRCLLTQDQDFFALHRANSDHAGIVHTTVDVNFKRLAANIVAEIEKRPDLTGRLLKVYRGSA